MGGVVGLREAPAEPLLLGQLVDGVGEVGKVGPAYKNERLRTNDPFEHCE